MEVLTCEFTFIFQIMAQPKCSTELRLMRDFCEYPEVRKPLISNDTIVHIQESSLVRLLRAIFTQLIDYGSSLGVFIIKSLSTHRAKRTNANRKGGNIDIYTSILPSRNAVLQDHCAPMNEAVTCVWPVW